MTRPTLRTDVLIAQHQWPTWGGEQIATFLKRQRDMYKFIHDQSVRLLNHGYTPNEIAEILKLPASLANDWSTRDYYGTLSHNAKAVYQKYLVWYDANLANLSPLPPVEQARKAVEYMGGADAVIMRARDDFKAGNYRWVASVMNKVVFADPANRTARELGADALEQLGYQTEAATWHYLRGRLIDDPQVRALMNQADLDRAALESHLGNAQGCCLQSPRAVPTFEVSLALLVAHRDEFAHGEIGQGRAGWRQLRTQVLNESHRCRIAQAQLTVIQWLIRKLT
jgi:hypothetical protein